MQMPIVKNQTLFYDNEKIQVRYWSVYPKYDFIFGVPTKKNKLYKTEKAFFQYRDTKNKKIKAGFYLDENELNDMIKGFKLIKKECFNRL